MRNDPPPLLIVRSDRLSPMGEEMITEDQELVSFTLALEEMATEQADGVGVKGLKFMMRQAARMIRRLRPDLAFTEHPDR